MLAENVSDGTAAELRTVWRIWYDDQCEVCQAGVAWLRWLDSAGRVEAIPLSALTDTVGRPPVPEEDLLRSLHAQGPDGGIRAGADAVIALASLFPLTAWIGWFCRLPLLHGLSRAAYGWVARNRYSLSRCRGGVCRSSRSDLVRSKAPWRAFQTCRLLGWGIITPISLVHYVRRLARQVTVWLATRGRRATLLDDRITIHFLQGGISSMVSILFGELFTMIRYRSLLIDPGGSRMRRSVERELRSSGAKFPISHVAATHAHEEHCGNLDLAARIAGATLHAHPRAIHLLRDPPRIPWMRSLVIGQPAAVTSQIVPLMRTLELDPALEVIETPGHCDEHICFYAPEDRLLLVGDGFMGTHFSSPNDDVDHHAWITSLNRLLELEVEIMVEAHGHVHTLREDVISDLERQGLGRILSRGNPRTLLENKREFLCWLADQLDLGRREGLPLEAIQATMFPWTQSWSYESAVQDRVASLVSGSGFGRHKVIRSFRNPAPDSLLPTVYELRWRQ